MPPTDTPIRSARPFLIGCVLLLALLEAIGFAYTRNPRHWSDFRVYYIGAYLLRTHPAQMFDRDAQLAVAHINPATDAVTLYLHPSYEALVVVPFTYLSRRADYLLYLAFGVFEIVATFFAARPWFSVRIPWLQPRPGFILLLFISIIGAIAWGQDTVLFLLVLTLTWRQIDRNKDLSAGALLALGLFKFQVALPLAALVAFRRGWRFTAGFLASAAAVALLSVALIGKAATVSMFRMLQTASLTQGQGFHAQHDVGIHPAGMPNVLGLLYIAGTRHLSPHTAFVIVCVVSLIVFLWTVQAVRKEPEESVAYALAILCAFLVSYHCFIYEWAMLALPLTLLANRIHWIVSAALNVLPLLLYVIIGRHPFAPLAVPLLAVLVYVGLNRPNAAAAPLSAAASP